MINCPTMPTLHPLFSSHAVLQRDIPVPVWGQAQPGAPITVALGGVEVRGVADALGRFSVTLPPLPAGGPHELMVSEAAGTATVRDILVGEVWICSGQSNMEWPVDQGGFPPAEIEASDEPHLRLFVVPKTVAAQPLATPQAQWTFCDAGTRPGFSAVGYAFGRDLQRRLGVPVGLIATSWGGTFAEAWLPRADLEQDERLAPIVTRWDAWPKFEPDSPEYQRLLAEWEQQAVHLDPGNAGEPKGWHRAELPKGEQSEWSHMDLPCYWEQCGLNIDGAVWFRREIIIPATWQGIDLELNLGPIDDYDTTYVNGVRVGGIGSETPDAYCRPRTYSIPAALVQSGTVVIAVRVFDRVGNGGICGKPQDLNLAPADGSGEIIPLPGTWAYRVELALPPTPNPPALPQSALVPSRPGGLFNGMIAPLAPYAARGVIWYQGESNADRGEQYVPLLSTLIAAWRRAFQRGLAFHIVQLCAFKTRIAQPGNSEWAELREAQGAVADSVPGCGLAVTIDTGDATDIHPRNKALVGHRLARLALRRDYGCTDVIAEGPVFTACTCTGSQARVQFRVEGCLTASGGNPVQGFAIAGADQHWFPAQAVIDGDCVVVSAPQVPAPVAVRYAWADNPLATLIDATGLPARPFRSDTWPLLSAGKR